MSLIAVTAPFADGEYAFGLYLGQWDALQEITKVGPHQLALAFATGEWLARWPREVIRLGLIGEGMDAVKAEALVRSYCDEHPFLEFIALASAIVGKSVVRPETAKKNGSDQEAEANDEPKPTSSTSPPIGATVQ